MRLGRSPRDEQTPFDRGAGDRLAVAATYVVLAFAVLGGLLVAGAAARSIFATGATEAPQAPQATGPPAQAIGESFAAAYLTHYAGESPEVSAARVAPYTSEAADPATVAMATDGNHTQRVINTAVVAVEPVGNNRHRVVVDALVGRPTTDGEATDGEATGGEATDGEVAPYNANTSETFERYRLEVYVANGAGVVAPPLLAEAEPTTDATEAVGGELEDIMAGGAMEDLRKFLDSYFAAAYGDPSSRSNLGQFYSSAAVASEIGLPPADLSYVELTGAGVAPAAGEAEGKANRYVVEAYVGVKNDARGFATNQTYVLEVEKTDGRWAITGEGGGR